MKKKTIICMIVIQIFIIMTYGLFSFEKTDSLNTKTLIEPQVLKRISMTDVTSFLGPLLGSFLAAMIAFYSIKKTHRNNLILEEKKQKKLVESNESKYCGLLHTILYVIRINDNLLSVLNSEILAYKEIVKELKKVTEKPFNVIKTELLQSYIIKLYDFDNINTSLLPKLSNYVILLTQLNENLSIKKIDTTVENDNKSAILIYSEYAFNFMEHIISKVQKLSEELKPIIEQEVKYFIENQ